MDSKVQNRLVWLKFVFLPIIKLGADNYMSKYGKYIDQHITDAEPIEEACNRIYDFIIKRKWPEIKTNDINEQMYVPDIDIEKLAGYEYYTYASGNAEPFKLTSLDICSILAYLCKQAKIEWDCQAKSKWEVQGFLKKSTFANMLLSFGLLKGATPIAPAQAAPETDNVNNPEAEVTPEAQPEPAQPAAQATTAPAAKGWKAQGPLSDKARDLKGNPHDKITLSVGNVYKIVDKNAGGNKETRLVVRPMHSKAGNGTTNVVYLTANTSDYECPCYFENKSDADTFASAVSNALGKQLDVVSSRVDKNGYFKVGSEYGDVYVTANKFNEDLTEDIEDNNDVEAKYAAYKQRMKELKDEFNALCN